MRRTMLGGLDAEPPSPEAASSEASAPMRPQKRNVKQTIIGGLEAPLGSAPGAVTSPPKRARPTQDTPPGTWLAALPDGKTLKVAERDLPRAIKKAYISMGTPLWRTGMSDWVPLNQIPELLSLLNKSATLPQAPGQESAEPANEPKRPQLPFSAQPLAPPNAPAQRAPSASSAKQAAIPRISGAPGPVAKVPSLSPKKLENAEFSPAQPQVSRGPASVSARNSSPSLELIEIENEDEIASIVAAESEHAELPVAPPSTAPNPARVSLRQPSPQPSTAPYRSPGDTISASRAASTAPSTAPLYPPQAMPVSRRPKRRGLVATLVSLLVVAVLVSSYVTRQPSALYAFLRAQGWEQGLDRVIQPLVLKVKNVIHR